MDQKLKSIRQGIWLFLIMILLGILDWLGYLAPVSKLGDLVFNPVEVRVEALKNRVGIGWNRVLGKDDLNSELLVMKQLVKDQVEGASELNKLRSENLALRKLIDIHPERMELKMGNVLATVDDGVFINVGYDHGVEKSMAVMVDGILWGKIVEVDAQKSIVETLDGDKSEWRVAVLNDKGEKIEGILGSKDGVLEIRGILVTDNIGIGDNVISVGGGDVLANLPIGKILSLSVVDETALYQFAQVAWPIDNDHIEQVAVIIKW